MSDVVIQVHGLSKKYRLGVLGTGTLRHDLNRWWHSVRGKPDPYAEVGEAPTFTSLRDDELWALRGVSFEVKQGEILGIIGRNGAGKSTLLKILSRVTAPTSGEVRVKGRIASLLEVGTGFHPELTGRENIFLNGAILGMTKSEIKRKFDEIVDFSGVEQFIDTPVKRYSSGMYVRLAFAVAAHLEPEILIVDEVLAVGDAEFQKKCLGKMQDVSAKEGRTVLFVSHNMASIARLCGQGLLLQQGRTASFGNIRDVIATYNETTFNAIPEKVWSNPSTAPGNHIVRLRAVRLRTGDNKVASGAIDITEESIVEIEYELLNTRSDQAPIAAIHVINEQGLVLFASADFHRSTIRNQTSGNSIVVSQCHIPGKLLAEGRFSVLAAMVTYNPNIVHALAPDSICFQAIETKGNGVRGDCVQDWPGIIRPELKWS